MGKLSVIVPPTMRVAVNAHAKVGQLDVLRRHDSGHDAALSTGNGALLVIDAHVGAGQIEVVRAAG